MNYGFDFIEMQRTSLKCADEMKALGYVKWVEIGGMCDIILHSAVCVCTMNELRV